MNLSRDRSSNVRLHIFPRFNKQFENFFGKIKLLRQCLCVFSATGYLDGRSAKPVPEQEGSGGCKQWRSTAGSIPDGSCSTRRRRLHLRPLDWLFRPASRCQGTCYEQDVSHHPLEACRSERLCLEDALISLSRESGRERAKIV